ncbi:MAG: outer membrane beta-barrel protein [Deltaproteobacteria bacterium]|nr:outer membrane beta-barrel protein [Deltaproteobacteria bacterium]
MNRSLFATALAIATIGTIAQAETADAGRYRFGGGGRVHARAHGGVSINYSRPAYRPSYSGYSGRSSWGVRGRIYVGPRYSYYPRYYQPYPRYYYYYQPVPSYYGTYSEPSYYPVQPAARTAVVVAPAARPQLPRFGIGLFAGGNQVEGTDGFDTKDSSEIGLLGRFRLTQGLLLEGEIGKQEYADNLRVDRKMGVALVYEIGAYNKLAPYVLGGIGVQQAEVGDGAFETRQNYGEIGIGLRYAATPNFHLMFDVRAGSRATASSDELSGDADVATRQVTPPSERSNDAENYSRARLAAMFYF